MVFGLKFKLAAIFFTSIPWPTCAEIREVCVESCKAVGEKGMRGNLPPLRPDLPRNGKTVRGAGFALQQKEQLCPAIESHERYKAVGSSRNRDLSPRNRPSLRPDECLRWNIKRPISCGPSFGSLGQKLPWRKERDSAS
jgi:hypothetical protein